MDNNIYQPQSHWYDSLPVIGAGMDILGSGYNFFKDLFGIDRGRDLFQSKELMSMQDYYNRASQSRAFQNQFALQARQQEFNEANMSKQFAMNEYLSNRGRDILNTRRAGLNPAAASGNPVSSVSLPSVGTPSSPMPTSSPLTYQGSSLVKSPDGLSSSLSAASEHMANAANTNIRNVTQLALSEAQVLETFAKARKSLLDGNATEIDLKYLDDEKKKTLDLLRSQAAYNDKAGDAATKQAEAAGVQADAAKTQAEVSGRNADTRQAELEETRRHNEVLEGIQRTYNRIYGESVQVERDKVEPIISELEARARKHNADAALTDQEVMWYASKINAIIDLYATEAYKTKQEGINTAKDNATYEYRLMWKVINDILDHIPFAGKTASADKQRIATKVQRSEHGMNAKGYKTNTERTDYYYTE